MEYTTEWARNHKDPLLQEVLFIISGGHYKEAKGNEQTEIKEILDGDTSRSAARYQ